MKKQDIYIKSKQVAKNLASVVDNEGNFNDSQFENIIVGADISDDLLSNISSAERVATIYNLAHKGEQDIDVANLMNTINYIERRNKRGRKLQLLSITAIVAAVIAMSFLVFYDRGTNDKLISNIIDSREIYQPTIILESDEIIVINESDIVANDDIEVDNKKIIYQTQDNYNSEKKESTGKTEYYTLVIPNKMHYSVILSDGTEVTLNAGSSLKYTKQFIVGDERVV